MASIAISASLQRACSSYHIAKKQQPQPKLAQSLGTKQASTNAVTLKVEDQTSLGVNEQVQDKSGSRIDELGNAENTAKDAAETESSGMKFTDQRWKNGTWDLNMFVKDGKVDWDGLIVAGFL